MFSIKAFVVYLIINHPFQHRSGIPSRRSKHGVVCFDRTERGDLGLGRCHFELDLDSDFLLEL